ncbi:S24 family peptidase [Achromobacter sp. KK8]|jgi:phage repressor protein C with HTH and peptisase S24 domain
MKIWTIEEEAAALRKRFEGVNRAAFARDHQVKGGQAMIYQHITGRRPISVEAAMAYASGFQCSLEEISPRLAIEAQKAAALSSEVPVAAPGPAISWPFSSISEAAVRALPPSKLNALDGALALAMAQLNIGIEVAPKRSLPSRAAAGSLVDIDTAADEFPMSIGGVLPPWKEGATTTHQLERATSKPLANASEVVTNVRAGDPPAANEKIERVPELGEVRLAAGDGIENHTEEITGFVQFRRSFLRSVGADSAHARVVYAQGDSMEPLIRDGAALLLALDEGLTLQDIAPGSVYAINYDGKMLVKTLAKDRLTRRWVARSINPKHPDISLEDDVPVRILGRIVWTGARLPRNVSEQ